MEIFSLKKKKDVASVTGKVDGDTLFTSIDQKLEKLKLKNVSFEMPPRKMRRNLATMEV